MGFEALGHHHHPWTISAPSRRSPDAPTPTDTAHAPPPQTHAPPLAAAWAARIDFHALAVDGAASAAGAGAGADSANLGSGRGSTGLGSTGARTTGGGGGKGYFTLLFFALYGILGSALFCAFYPWT